MLRRTSQLVISVVVVVVAPPVDACAVCSTADRALATAGDEQPFEQRFRVMLDARAGTTRIGDSSLRDRRVELAASRALGRNELVGVAVPVLARDIAYLGDESKQVVLGDVELRLQFVTLRSSRRQRAGVLADIAFPTAPLAHDARGARLPVAFQPGCGAIAPAIGGYYAMGTGDWSSFASAQIVMPLSVRDGPHSGRSVRATAWLQWQPRDSFAVRGGVFSKAEGRGEFSPGESDPNSGGWVTFVSMQAIVMPVTDLVLGAGVLVPIAQVSVGARREGAIASLNAAFDF